MQVRVELYSDLKKYAHGRDEPLLCTVSEGSTVNDVLAALGIPSREEIIVGINGELGSRETVLADGDTVTLLTPMEGGARTSTPRGRRIGAGPQSSLD